MDREQVQNEIIRLTREIDRSPEDVALYIRRGKLYYRAGTFDKAMNDFVRVRTLESDHVEAGEYIRLISEIFAFYHQDLYNP